jgi:mRNA interferase HigB
MFPKRELLKIICIFGMLKAMRVIARKTLKLFWEKHKDCEQQLKSWYDEVVEADWHSPNAIKINYPSASFLTNNRVVFNIKGNSYCLIVRINYKYRMVWIRFVGTHSQYDKIDANRI